MAKLPGRGLATAAILFVVDQLIKWVVTGPMDLHMLGDVREIVSFFNLRFVPNYGISLGLLTADSNASRWALVAMTGAIAVAVAFWMTRERSPVDQMALGCVLGGGWERGRYFPHSLSLRSKGLSVSVTYQCLR